MLEFLTCTLAGILGGFGSSCGVGPINLWMADAAFMRRYKDIYWFLLGVVITDICYAFLAAWGYHSLLIESPYLKYISYFGAIFMILIGISLFFKKNSEQQKENGIQKKSWKYFFLGTILTGSNPGFLLFWVFVIDFLSGHIGISVNANLLAIFLLGVAIGDLAWFGILAKIVAKFDRRENSKFVRHLRSTLALVFIASGLWVITQEMLKA
ncbi:MAG: LysE family translocator [Oligoflexales bacterium]